ncbi:DNA repair protein complementing XP-C cells homolog [Wyeomyia smithii]|uniref:DNA repair protein complementing XP-C cells homolog n=1 Tax=Wyeomyia smithii TaxID=174621 RepID=UPI00246819B8|nr:DNA repair protein complementing XP-C cells homolog [Wyeomyia smithii]
MIICYNSKTAKLLSICVEIKDCAFLMRRSRRSTVTARKTKVQVSDDDFESASEDFTANEDGDFSASEDEWLPGKKDKTKGASGQDTEDYEGADESDNEEEYNTSQEEESESDKSSVVSKRNRSSKVSPKQPLKRKRLSPGTRDELYKRTKKQLLKETNTQLPPLSSSISDILQKCRFQRKQSLPQSQEKKKAASKKIRTREDSDSSGDDHLVDPEKLDLNSKFFEPTLEEDHNRAPPTFDCNAGMRLSDDSSDDELDEPIPASIPKLAADKLIHKINESSSGYLSFNNHAEFTVKLEEAKQLLRNYESVENKNNAEDEKSNTDHISNLLALGETEAGTSSSKPPETGQKNLNNDVSDESDWEEVEDAQKSQQSTGQQTNAADYQISVEVETSKSKKKRWEEIEMELYIKRQINKVKRENQLAYHKSSVLCAIAVGRKLNEIAGSDKLCSILLSLMQSKQCQVKGKVDVKCMEQLMEWYKGTFELCNQQMLPSKGYNLRFSLSLGLFTHKLFCKRDYLLLFLTCLRTVGIECRLVLSASVPPKRPAMKDLCPISERLLIEQFEKDYCRKNPAANKSDDKSPEKQPSLSEKADADEKTDKCKTEPGNNVENNLELKPKEKCASEIIHPSVSPQQIEAEKPSRVTRSRSKRSCSKKNVSEIRFSLVPENITRKRKSKSLTPSPSSTKENLKPVKGILRSPSPKFAAKKTSNKKSSNTLSIPQLDGINDLESTPNSVPLSRRLRSRARTKTDEEPAKQGTHFSRRLNNKSTMKATITEQNNNQPGKILKRKLCPVTTVVKSTPENSEKLDTPTSNKILAACSSESESPSPRKSQKAAVAKKTVSRKPVLSDSDDSDFEPPDSKKKKNVKASNSKKKTPPKKTPVKKKNNSSVKKAESKPSSPNTSTSSSNKTDLWLEFYSEKHKKWLAVDLFTGKIDCADYLARHATTPISYVFGFDADNHVKDVTARYVQHWNTVCRKLRVESKWLNKALKPFCAEKTERDQAEDNELNKIHIDKPLPTTIAECKNHPLYVLKRHLLKFEALYPPDLPSLGFVRGEAIYARECLFVLQTREKWFKQARVVKPFETAYKVVKCWKYDRQKNEWLGNQPCDIFGVWQTEEYDPPTAENGIVPRNEYGNVELFTPKMLPKKTVHLQLPGLNRVCRRLGIDCAPALTGFEKARMRMVPVYDGFVVCEEFGNQVVEEWYKEMEQEERREQEKFEKRVYGNWKRLIRGLLVRRKLQNKYNFDNL